MILINVDYDVPIKRYKLQCHEIIIKYKNKKEKKKIFDGNNV